MDPPFSDASGVATIRRGRKRPRSPEEEMQLQFPESDIGSSGRSENRRTRDRMNTEKESVPPAERGKIRGERQRGQSCEEESQQRRLRNTVRTSRDPVLSAAPDKNSSNSVSRAMQHETSCKGKYPNKKRKHSPLPERNSSLDLPALSPTRRNELRIPISRSSEISASPDYVRIVQQMENDEYYARSLQAEFDREAEQEQQQPVAAGRGRILRSTVSHGPALIATAGSSTTPSPDHEATEGRPSTSIQDSRNEVRASRASASRRSARSNRRQPSSQHFLNAGSFIQEIGLTLPFTNFLSVVQNSNSIFISVQDMHLSNLNIGNFYDFARDTLDSDAGLNNHGLSTTQISRLPTRRYCETRTSGREETFESNECQICLCAYEVGVMLRTLPCFHEFHNSCIDKWLEINRSCPICRALIAVDSDDQ